MHTIAPYYYLIASWILFFGFHSFLASSKVKAIAQRSLSSKYYFYRLGYNILSMLLLVIVFLSYQLSPEIWLFNPGTITLIAGAILSFIALYILFDSFRNYNTQEFLGIYQMTEKAEFKTNKFSSNGWNNVVRHPLYFGTIVFAIGFMILIPSYRMLITAILIILYTIIGTLWEEQKLVKEFGEDYKTYQQNVSMLIPIRWVMQYIKKL